MPPPPPVVERGIRPLTARDPSDQPLPPPHPTLARPAPVGPRRPTTVASPQDRPPVVLGGVRTPPARGVPHQFIITSVNRVDIPTPAATAADNPPFSPPVARSVGCENGDLLRRPATTGPTTATVRRLPGAGIRRIGGTRGDDDVIVVLTSFDGL